MLAALGLPLLLVHCAAPVIVGTTDDSALIGNDDATDAGDAGDARTDAGDAGDAGDAATEDAGDAGAEEVDAATAPPPVPKKPTTPIAAGDASDDASTTDLSSTYPDPSKIQLGPLPDGSGGCASAPAPTGLDGAPLLAMLCLVALRRKRE